MKWNDEIMNDEIIKKLNWMMTLNDEIMNDEIDWWNCERWNWLMKLNDESEWWNYEQWNL